MAGRIDDEDGRGGDAIAEQVVDTIRLGHGVVWVGQDREGGTRHAGHRLGTGQTMHSQSDDLGVARLKLLVMVLQIDDLLAARASGLALIKDEHHIRPVSIVAQGDGFALGALQDKVRGRLCRHYPG